MKHLLHFIVVAFAAFFVLLIASCSPTEPTYHIGVSQCLDDAWRQKMNHEMDRELLHYSDMELSTRVANGSNELQCQQIDSFIRENVDLLIVSPNEAEAVRPAVTRAYRAGIPVIVADRRVLGNEWTAFIGGDNRRVGRLMGEWIARYQAKSKRPLHVLEVTGLPGSTPATLRHEGMMEVLDSQPTMISSVMGSWLQDSARSAVAQYLQTHSETEIDLVVAQNDLMAVGASEALPKQLPIMGVDGISVGLQAIVDGWIECTATYSSRGDMVIKVAHQILTGQTYVRDTVLETTMIDADAAKALLIQYNERAHDLETLQIVQARLDDYWEMYRTSTRLLIIGFSILFLLFTMALLYLLIKHRQLSTEIKEEVVPQMEDVLQAIKLNSKDEAFAERLQHIVDDNLQNPDLSVEYLCQAMSLSRTQVFRRVKTVSGKGPLEYIRERRLIRANHLLKTTDMTVQQVANELCFTSASYFTKCYKEHFSQLPSVR